MKRLRHPIRAIREPFGTAGLVVAMVALVAALGGTAFAASKLNSTQKKEVTKIAQTEAKKFAGKNGATGATGPAGPAGPAGAAGAKGETGAKGDKGEKGDTGDKGDTGNPGKNVAIGTATSGECSAGGSTVEVAGEASTKKAVCNGSPWTAGGTLPKGSTETGAWSVGFAYAAVSEMFTFSFPIPLAATPTVIYLKAGATSPECPGTAAAPKAKEGKFCIYTEIENKFNGFTPLFEFKSGVGGLMTLNGGTGANEEAYAVGTWAVTSAS